MMLTLRGGLLVVVVFNKPLAFFSAKIRVVISFVSPRYSQHIVGLWKKEIQYMGPGTHLAKRLKRGDPGINRLDQIAKQHDIDYSRAKNLQDKWKADTKMIQAIDRLPSKKTKTERVVKKIMQAKKRLKL